MIINKHLEYMTMALDLAKYGKGNCSPNPSVGAVIVDHNGVVISMGYHKGVGHSHAEVEALKNVDSSALRDSTLYVTLEPCNHFGKTPPCTQAIIKSGITKVFYGYKDPNPIVSGKGMAELNNSGINCKQFEIPEINNFYKSYDYWTRSRLPFVTAKLALSLDGKIAGHKGQRIQITGEELQVKTHQLRQESDAILTTSKTIIYDDPQLNVRLHGQTSSKPIYVLDSYLRTPLHSKIFTTSSTLTFLHSKNVAQSKKDALLAAGAKCIEINEDANGLALLEVLTAVGNDGIHDLWVEAGGSLFSSLLSNNMLHQAFIYVAPKYIYEGMNAFNRALNFSNMKQIMWSQCGNDVLAQIIF